MDNDPLPEMEIEGQDPALDPADSESEECPSCGCGILVGQIREVKICLSCGREWDWKISR